MTEAAKKLLTAAMELSLADRRAMMQALYESTDETDEVEYEMSPEWLDELDRRCADFDAGLVETFSWEEVRRHARETIERDAGDE